MSGINGKRILIGGLAAGVVIIVFEAASQMLLGEEWNALFQQLGVAVPGEAAMFTMLPGMLVLGVLAVWVYALAVPRLGAKAETACVVGLTVWALACVLPNLMFMSLGILNARLFLLGTLVTVVQMPLAVWVGSLLYRDSAAGSVRAINTRAA
jgi:hypothetical protein